MALLGLEWRAAAADLDEEAWLLEQPLVAAINVALAKAAATQISGGEVVVAADTLVVVDGDILGKPADREAARRMLERLRNRGHQVLTGVTLKAGNLHWAGAVSTQVLMRDYAREEVEAYLDRGEPFDKAGGYAIQDQTFHPVDHLEGCYLNVVGLPLCAVAAGLNALGVSATSAGTPPCTYCARGVELVRSG